MDKRQLHHLWTKIRRVKIWYVVVLLVIASIVAVFALRQNNLRMVELRQAVYQADEQGGDAETALQNLRKHVYAHMNTDLAGGQNAVYPPVQLKYTYQRLQQAEKERATQDSARIYTDAQNTCERQFPTGFSGSGRIPCIQKYISEHGSAEKSVPDALYKFSFTSPSWSPDLAGFSVAFAGLLALLLIVRVIAGRILKSLTK
ncbi:MAG: hypothetical protein ABWX94_03145 [Candidatus Saccharimonadales bacterium]